MRTVAGHMGLHRLSKSQWRQFDPIEHNLPGLDELQSNVLYFRRGHEQVISMPRSFDQYVTAVGKSCADLLHIARWCAAI